MKLAASILLLVWTVLLVEPGFANYAMKAEASSCTKKYKTVEPTCSKSKCSKPESTKVPADSKEDKDCTKNRCNPLMSCPAGNFYLLGFPQLIIAPFILVSKKKAAFDDKRLSKQLSECWHPPEVN